jgi:hypothetical protein
MYCRLRSTFLGQRCTVGQQLGYFDCKAESECLAYLADLEAKQVRTEVSEKQFLDEIAKRSSGLGPEGRQVLKNVADYLTQTHGKGRSRK